MDLWYNEKGPGHLRSPLADQTVFWASTDSKDLYLKNRKEPEKSKLLDELGWTDKNITYSYNHQGFRCENFDDRPAGLAIGCSLTEGVGVKQDQTWPSVLSKLLDIHIWNLGIGGQSIASNFRILDHYLPLLKPRFVVHCIPNKHRFEYTNEIEIKVNVTISSMLTDTSDRTFFKKWFAHDDNSNYYSLAHSKAIKWLCHEHQIPYFYMKSEMFDFDKKARDLQHPGPDAHVKFAQNMYNLISKTQGETKWN